MARLTEQDGITRGRWARFLKPLVGAGRVSVAELDARLANLTGRSGDARGEIYAYLKGTQTVKAARAWNIGEALRTLGVAWCSGPVALYAAGYRAEFVQFIAALATLDRAAVVRPSVTLALSVRNAVADERARADALSDGVTASEYEGQVAFERQVLAGAYNREQYAEARRLANLARRPRPHYLLALADQIATLADSHAGDDAEAAAVLDDEVQWLLDAWASGLRRRRGFPNWGVILDEMKGEKIP